MRFNSIKLFSLTAALFVALSVVSFSCDKQPIGPTGPDPVGPPAPGTFMTFAEFRALHTGGGDVTIPAGTKKIRGIVISNNVNEAAGNYRLQDESGAGLYLYTVIGSPIYPMGTVLEINPAGGGVLTLFNGDLELKNVPQTNVVILAGTIAITPIVKTIPEIIANRDALASSLVKINGITSITQTSSNSTGITYKIKTTINDSLSTFVRGTSGITVNTSGTSLTGYVSIFNTTTQVQIRTAADIQ